MKACEGPGCAVKFEPRRANARFHSATCRQRAARARKAAAVATAEVDLSVHEAVLRELEAADRLETTAGQLALLLAREVGRTDGKTLVGLSRELRELVAAALAGVAPDDEVSRLRRARDEKRRLFLEPGVPE